MSLLLRYFAVLIASTLFSKPKPVSQSKSKMSRKVDWSSLAGKLKPETVSAIQAFRGRQAALQKQVSDLKEQLSPINYSQYESVLKNTSVVAEAKKSLSAFKPSPYPLKEQLANIEASRVKAVSIGRPRLKSVQPSSGSGFPSLCPCTGLSWLVWLNTLSLHLVRKTWTFLGTLIESILYNHLQVLIQYI